MRQIIPVIKPIPCRQPRIMTAHNNTGALGGGSGQNPQEMVGIGIVLKSGRLIQKQVARLMDHGPRHARSLALATG